MKTKAERAEAAKSLYHQVRCKSWACDCGARISMRDFFSLPEVIAQQDIQKLNPYESAAHISADKELERLANEWGVAAYVGVIREDYQ